MSDKFRVFGTQFDPSVVQALMRQEQQREASELNRAKAATKRRRAAEKQQAQQERRSNRTSQLAAPGRGGALYFAEAPSPRNSMTWSAT